MTMDNRAQIALELDDFLDQCYLASDNEVKKAIHLARVLALGSLAQRDNIDVIIPSKPQVVEAGKGVWIQSWLWIDDKVEL